MEHYYLLAHTPLAADKRGFALAQGQAVWSGAALRQALETALFFYALGKDPEFAELVKVFLLAGRFDRIPSVRDFLLERLRERYAELGELELPERLSLGEIVSRPVFTIDLDTGAIVKRDEHQVFIGVLEFSGHIPEVFRYAGLSFSEALARAELRRVRESFPGLVPFYQDWTNRLRRMEVPLRGGYWTEDPFAGLLLAYWRVKEVREVIRKRLRQDPAPKTLLYSPKDKATLGWLEIRTSL